MNGLVDTRACSARKPDRDQQLIVSAVNFNDVYRVVTNH